MIYRRLGGGVGVVKIQHDSIIFKTVLKASADSKSSKASNSSVAVVPSPLIAPQNQRNHIASFSTNQISAAQSNGSTPWPYSLHSLPSLLANVPVPSSFTSSSSFTDYANGVISVSAQVELNQPESSDILTVHNQGSSATQPTTSSGVTSDLRQQASASNNIHQNSSTCKLFDI